MTARPALSVRLCMVAVALSIAGCDVTDPIGDLRVELERNRLQWSQVAPDSYSYVVQHFCYCGIAGIDVRITVDGPAVTDRVFEETGDALPEGVAESYPAVEGLFAFVEDALDRGAHSIEITYDPDTGVPLEISVDYRENVIDEEARYAVVELPAPVP